MPNAALGVHERHRGAPAPGPRRLVDQATTLGPHPLQRGGAVVDPVPHVVDALALGGQELGHRRVVADRREQLHVRLGHLEQRLLDAVALHHLAVLDLDAVGVAVVLDRGLEVVDGDGDVVDLGEHQAILMQSAPEERDLVDVLLAQLGIGDAESLVGREHQHPELALVLVVVHLQRPRRPPARTGTSPRAPGGCGPRAIRRLASHASR